MRTTVYTSVLLILLVTIVQCDSAESITSTNSALDTAIRRLRGSHKLTKEEAEKRGVVMTAPVLAAGLKSSAAKVNPAKLQTALPGLSLKDRSKTTKIISTLVALGFGSAAIVALIALLK